MNIYALATNDRRDFLTLKSLVNSRLTRLSREYNIKCMNRLDYRFCDLEDLKKEIDYLDYLRNQLDRALNGSFNTIH